MSYDNKDSSHQTRAVIRGKMLIVSFPDATPPVLWRWLAGDVSSGFGLRKNESKVDLLRFDGGATPAVVASFASVEAAEHALDVISDALERQNAPWKYAAKWVGAVLSLAMAIGLVAGPILYYQYLDARQELFKTERTALEHTANRSSTVANGLPVPGQLPERQRELMQQRQKEEATKPPEPTPGSAVDVDSIYH